MSAAATITTAAELAPRPEAPAAPAPEVSAVAASLGSDASEFMREAEAVKIPLGAIIAIGTLAGQMLGLFKRHPVEAIAAELTKHTGAIPAEVRPMLGALLVDVGMHLASTPAE